MPHPLIDRLEPLLGQLTRFARWVAGSAHDGDDIVQETLVRALRASDVPFEDRSLKAWLFRIARNANVDLRRRRAAHDRLVVLEGGLDELSEAEASPSFLDPIEVPDLEAALAQLPEGARAAVVLADVWEFEHEEIARILDIPVGTVKSRVARARARLALILAESHPTARRGG